MVDCLSCQSCCGSLRSSKLYPKEKRPVSRKRAAQQLQKQISNSNEEKSKLTYSFYPLLFPIIILIIKKGDNPENLFS